jgi:hypothetical protein
MNRMNAAPHNLPTERRTSLTDSAWFWAMLFSCVGLLALQVIDWKYNQRQAQLERQFQGRQWAAQHGAQVQMNPQNTLERATPVPVVASEGQQAVAIPANAESAAPKAGEPAKAATVPTYSRPGQLVISLWPLRAMAMAVLIASSMMLWRQTHPTVPSEEKQAP